MKRKLNVIMIMALLTGTLAVPDTIEAAGKKAVELNTKEVTLTIGETTKLKLKHAPKNKTITWDSSNKSVAAVTKKGNVTVKKRGKATITAESGKKKYTCKVTVIKKNAADVAALKQLIKKHRKAGAKVPEDINSMYYSWNEKGRLDGISWSDKKLKGSISFSKLPSLEWISVYDNQLTGLDITGNVNLTEIDCTSNRLTKLDVTHNTKLEELHFQRNKLTELDITRNVMLKQLGGPFNRLKKLDVSNNTALKYLNVGYNRLTDLDISKNTALKDFYCDYNKLTMLDTTMNENLRGLSFSDNQLTAIDVSRNLKLEWLICSGNQLTELDVRGNKELAQLECSKNQLASLDVSQNQKLEWFLCEYNKLTELDVSKNRKLKKLWCYGNKIKELNLKNNKQVYKLSHDEKVKVIGLTRKELRRRNGQID